MKVNRTGTKEFIVLAKLGVVLTEANFAKNCELSDVELDIVEVGGGEYSDGSVRCVWILGGDGNW